MRGLPVVLTYVLLCAPAFAATDVVFTGTPEGVGYARKPPRFLHPGDVLTSTIEGIGDLVTHLV